MDETSFALIAEMMPSKVAAPNAPEHLFSEQATHGVTVNTTTGTDDYETKFAEWSKA